MPVPTRRRPSDEEDERPRRRPAQRGRSEEDDEEDDRRPTPPRGRRTAQEDEDDERPARRGSRRSDDDDEEDERPRRNSRRSDDGEDDEEDNGTGYGWDQVAKRKAYVDENGFDDKDKPVYAQLKNTFRLGEDEEAVIQFLTDQPVCVNGYVLKSQKFAFYVSQKLQKKYCLMADAGFKEEWRAAFKILDFRKWEKSKKKGESGRNVESDEPTEKFWLAPYALAEQIKAYKDKVEARTGKKLSQVSVRVSKSGSGQKSRYNFEPALDHKDRPLAPIDWDEELPTLKEAMKPMPETVIEKVVKMERNFSASESRGGSSKNAGRGRRNDDDDDDYAPRGRRGGRGRNSDDYDDEPRGRRRAADDDDDADDVPF